MRQGEARGPVDPWAWPLVPAAAAQPLPASSDGVVMLPALFAGTRCHEVGQAPYLVQGAELALPLVQGLWHMQHALEMACEPSGFVIVSQY